MKTGPEICDDFDDFDIDEKPCQKKPLFFCFSFLFVRGGLCDLFYSFFKTSFC